MSAPSAPTILRNVRRVHHLNRITIRNLDVDNLEGPVNVFYTLSLPLPSLSSATCSTQTSPRVSSNLLYTSEVCTETLNPSWDYIRSAEFTESVPQRAKALHLEIWREHTTPSQELQVALHCIALRSRLSLGFAALRSPRSSL